MIQTQGYFRKNFAKYKGAERYLAIEFLLSVEINLGAFPFRCQRLRKPHKSILCYRVIVADAHNTVGIGYFFCDREILSIWLAYVLFSL